MELIKKLGTLLSSTGRKESWAEFYCSFCNKIVRKRLDSGKICKSCGCIKNELIGEANKGKKRTEEQNKINSEIHLGKKHPLFGKNRSEETKYKIRESNKGKKRTAEQKLNMSKSHIGKTGELASNWQNGKSFEIYPKEFNKALKQSILERDNYTCQCLDCIIENITDLHIHHIDFNKQNNDPENLITLCNSCHAKTNGKNKRNYFTEFYKNIIMERINEFVILFR